MNWFEEQINKRRNQDKRALSDAYESAVNAIIGESFSFEEAEDELTIILRYYRLPIVRISNKITDDNERLSSMCRLSGLMQRPVKLDKGWYKHAFGAFLCKLKSNNKYVAVVPSKFFGYYSYYDKEKKKRVRITRKTAQLLSDEAICFYKPLPAKKLHLWDLLKFALTSWSISDYVYIFLLLGITTLIGLLTPKLTQFLYSTVITEKSISLLLSTLTFIASVSLSLLLINVVQGMFNSRSGIKMQSALESASMMRMLSLPATFFKNYSSGEILARMNGISSICSEIVSMVFGTTLTSLFSLAYISQIFAFTPALVVPAIIVILVNVAFSIFTTVRQTKIAKRMMEISVSNSGVGIEILSGVQKIKMSGSEKRIFAKYTKTFANQSRVAYNPPFFIKYNGLIAQAISYVGVVVIYFVAIKGKIDVSQYYAFNSAYGVIDAAITALVGVALQAAGLKPSLEMIKPILDVFPETGEKTQEVVDLSGSIEANNVTFRYDEQTPNVIENFSVKINAGQYIAIVGKTGCGKSTLVRLLLGFEKPQRGSIYYDGKDLALLEKRSLRQKIGTVMQDDRLFNSDIFSNIIICAPTLTMDRAWEAAEIAGIADDIREMPMGMHTIISEGSGGISGGQRQRLVIARAIAPKPKILIFDEATSALDNITQKKISESLDKLKCTRIVIAHRLSTIRNCDRILVMDKGKIIEDGTYQQLIDKKGYFAELVERQRLDTNTNDK